MDIQNFLDPMGGSGRGTIWDGGMGILGMVAGPVSGFLGGRYFKKEVKLEKKLRASARSNRKVNLLLPYNPDLPDIGVTTIHSKPATRISANPTHNYTGPSKRLKSAKASVRNLKSTMSTIGWAYTASWLFDIGQSILTPGISKTAARSNQELIMNEAPLDSGRAFTQRQRAMQAIYESQGAVGRSMIGQESSFLHM